MDTFSRMRTRIGRLLRLAARTGRAGITMLLFGTMSFYASASAPTVPPEFTHRNQADWINTAPLTLAALKGKVVLVEFWAFECINCLNSRAWVDSIAQRKESAGLVVIGVHTPELFTERSAQAVQRAVSRLGIRHPVMIDTDSSYWEAVHNHYWPAFYVIGRDGLMYGSIVGEMHVGDERARKLEGAIDLLLAAPTAR